MNTERIWEMVTAQDPLDTLVRRLAESFWTAESSASAKSANQLEDYLIENEHAISSFERQVYDVFPELYSSLEGPHTLKRRLEDEVFPLEQFTVVVFDALSLRELPAVMEVLEEAGFEAHASHALSSVPSDTGAFTQDHFQASGPSAIAESLFSGRLAYRHVKKQDWTPDFKPEERRRVVWALYPDNVFNLDHGAINYGQHILAPVQDLLRSLLAAESVLPLIVTSDHGYVWQGGNAFWPVEGEEAEVLARHFKHGRCTNEATVELTTRTDKAWVHGLAAAARGRFAWGGKVRGPTKLFKHGGVSLMECVTPWVQAS